MLLSQPPSESMSAMQPTWVSEPLESRVNSAIASSFSPITYTFWPSGVPAMSSLPERPVPLVVGHSESTVDAMQLSEPPD